MAAATNEKKMTFQTEVKQLLDIIAGSLYSEPKVFLRELISNASDAVERLRFEALTKPNLLDDRKLQINIKIDEDNQCLIIEDNGIGMSEQDVLDNLGTIARSGTRAVLDSMSQEESKTSQLIGQFGVGFYSAFVVADKVVVETRKAGLGPKKAIHWESLGDGEFTIRSISMPETGTRITLHMKEDAKQFLESFTVKQTVKGYSEHINVPIVFFEKEVIVADDDTAKDSEVPKKEEIKEMVLNDSEALWTLSKKSISKEQYESFYNSTTHDPQPPLTWIHQRIEGSNDYTMLLYIPEYAPFDLWMRERTQGVKLYVKRVFIMDDPEKLMPMYLRFVQGLVDSNDLPLNVSRELLQDHKALDSIRAGCVKRVLSKLEKMAKDKPEDYTKFWKAFGAVLKEGPAEDFQNRERLFKLVRFASTHLDSDEQAVSLQDYVGRMKEDQTKIYYLISDSYTAAQNSPHLEYFKAQGIEVILLFDKVDEWLMSHLTEFDGKTMQSIMQGDIESMLGDDAAQDGDEDSAVADKEAAEDKQAKTGPFAGVLEQLEKALEQQVKEVRETKRLTDSPCCLVTDKNEISQHLKRLLQNAGQVVPETKPVLEINAEHPLVKQLMNEQDDTRFDDWGQLLYEQAQLLEGSQLADPAGFVKRVNRLMQSTYGEEGAGSK